MRPGRGLELPATEPGDAAKVAGIYNNLSTMINLSTPAGCYE